MKSKIQHKRLFTVQLWLFLYPFNCAYLVPNPGLTLAQIPAVPVECPTLSWLEELPQTTTHCGQNDFPQPGPLDKILFEIQLKCLSIEDALLQQPGKEEGVLLPAPTIHCTQKDHSAYQTELK